MSVSLYLCVKLGVPLTGTFVRILTQACVSNLPLLVCNRNPGLA